MYMYTMYPPTHLCAPPPPRGVPAAVHGAAARHGMAWHGMVPPSQR